MTTFTDNIGSRQRGVTLVELLVSLVLGLLLTAGMIKVFSGNRVTYEFNQGLSRIQENARFALDHVAYNTRMAGYTGCISDVTVYNNLTDAAVNPFRYDIENGIQGFEADGTGVDDEVSAAAVNPAPAPATDADDWSPALPLELQSLVIPYSDVLVVRGISGDAMSLVSPFTNAAQLFAAEPNDFVDGEILVVSDCQKASIFQVTEAAGENIVHSNAGSFVPGNNGPNWGSEQDYGLGAEVARLQSYVFFVGQGANGTPALFQLRLQYPTSATSTAAGFVPEELVEGIDSMQVRYGRDTDADEDIDIWETADAIGDWTQVVAVEVTLLARSTEEYGTVTDTAEYNLGGARFDPAADRRLRQVFSTTIGARNRLP